MLQIANLLCPGNIVVSGSKAACDRVAALAEAAGAMKVIPLAVAGAFHTPLMQPAVDRLAAALADVEIRKPRIPVISNVDAQPHDDPEEIRAAAGPPGRQPRALGRLDALHAGRHGVEKFYEVGPGRVLAGLLKRIDRRFPCENIAALSTNTQSRRSAIAGSDEPGIDHHGRRNPTRRIQVDLSGQIALVTGASRGIGKAIALTLGRAGAKVACVARNERQARRDRRRDHRRRRHGRAFTPAT